ncbi:type II toxin-antitoxin system VapC family toxin [Sorangium sp. So ce375]|uniref:type II toxin-antitoxin system VapC family toxin n=1 Tax=Sorangium sp. So ce375 TaxID=3133306 RepID=UPI003F5BFDB2
MSPRFLLDTSTISEPMKKAPDEAMLAKIEAHAHESALAAPVWHELWYGCRLLPSGKRRTALEAYLREVVYVSFPILPYDAAASAWHANERARLDGKGTPAPFVDGQIAAIAKSNDLILVTANVRDFQRFQDLPVESWSSRKKK